MKVNVFNNQIDLLLSGPIPPNPAELLGSQSFTKVLNNIKQSYDYIIIDSAPLVLVSDTIPEELVLLFFIFKMYPKIFLKEF